MTVKEIVCRVVDRIVMIVVLDDDKEVGSMKRAVVYRMLRVPFRGSFSYAAFM